MPVVADTTDTESVEAMAEAAAELGRLDILVNGAAAPAGLVRNDIEDADPEALLADLNTKVVGYFRCVKAVAPAHGAHRYGRIVNIGGLTGRSSHALSGMRNLAVVHMTKALSDQLGPHGITVNTLHPAWWRPSTSTSCTPRTQRPRASPQQQVEQNFIDRTPIRRVLTAAEVADAVCFFASRAPAASPANRSASTAASPAASSSKPALPKERSHARNNSRRHRRTGRAAQRDDGATWNRIPLDQGIEFDAVVRCLAVAPRAARTSSSPAPTSASARSDDAGITLDPSRVAVQRACRSGRSPIDPNDPDSHARRHRRTVARRRCSARLTAATLGPALARDSPSTAPGSASRAS